MKQLSSFTLACAFLTPFAALGQTVFSDTFGSSTLNTANTTPTATSTGYQVASTKASTSSLNPGDLSLSFPSTSSGIAEIQALFTTTPISLTSVGQFVDLNITFTDTSGLLPGASSFIAGGLYNSGGNAPVNNGQLAASGIGGTTFPTGNAQTWAGYVGIIRPSTTSSSLVTRPAQLGTAATPNTDQELIGNSFSTTGGYNNPAGANLHTLAATVSLTTGATYNYDFRVTLSAAGTETISDSLTTTGATPTTLFSDSGTATGANLLATTFDGLAFGDRSGTAGTANTMDISDIVVNSNASVPEPTTLALSGLSLVALTALRRLRR